MNALRLISTPAHRFATGTVTILLALLLLAGAAGPAHADVFGSSTTAVDPSVATTAEFCAPTGVEAVRTDQPSYPNFETVHIDGDGYGPNCQVTVRVTRPDGSVVRGDGNNTPGSDVVVTDAGGSFTNDYILNAIDGLYTVEVLGRDDAVLAAMTFWDAFGIDKLRRGTASGIENYLFAAGDVIYPDASVDTGKWFKVEVRDAGGTLRGGIAACTPNASFNATTASYLVKATDPPSNAADWTFTLIQYKDASCATEDKTDAQAFDVVQATAYKEAALTNVQSTFGAGATAYLRLQGVEQDKNDHDTTWILPSGATACANTGGGDRPDSDANGRLPKPAASYLQFPPAGPGADPWNLASAYDAGTCPAFSAANQGQWKLRLERDAKHVVTLDVFSVQTNQAPTVSATNGSVAVNEGQTAANAGTYSDANGGDNVTISASRGTVTKTGTSSGTWSWSLATTDGPDQTGPVTITANDGNGGTAATTFTLNVGNVAPTVSLAAGNPLSVNEGPTQQTYSYTISDPGADTVSAVTTSCGANGVKVAGSDTNTNTTGSFKCTFADGPNTSVVSATATDSDNAAGNLATQAVTVANVAPTASVSGPAAADEGTTKTYTFTVTDPGTDTFAVDAGFPDCDAGATNNGTFAPGSLSVTATGGSFQCSFADGPSSANVKIGVRDSDGASDTASQSVQIVAVANVAPTVTAAANQTANEGASTSFNLGSFTDPGADSPWAVDVDWGDGSAHATFDMTLTGSLGTQNHTYADGPGSRTVTVTVTDKNGAGDTETFTVQVANVAPTVTLAAANVLSVGEGQAHVYSYTISDPGQDTVSSVATSCGANATKSDATNSDSGGSFKCTFPDGPASSTVTAQATDSDGDTGNEASQTVSVANVAPTATLDAGNDLSVDEGASEHSYSYSIDDPGADTVSAVTTSCGANGAKVTGSDTNTNTTGSFKCTFADGPNTSVVSASATDSDGAAGNLATQSVTVNNVAPTVHLTGASTADEGQTKTYTYTVTDPGSDPSPAITESCGGNGDLTDTAASHSFECTFPDGPASSTVKVAADDGDPTNNTGSDEIDVTVANVAPTVDLTGADTADEGQTKTYTYTVTDPGSDPAPAIDESCGGNGTRTDTAAASSFQCTFPDGPASSTVKVTADDGDRDAQRRQRRDRCDGGQCRADGRPDRRGYG